MGRSESSPPVTHHASRITHPPHVVIVGGGFGGLEAAKALGGAPARVTLIDRRNHFLFQPLLYQVATAGLSPGNIATPIRAVVRRYRNVQVLLAEVVGVDLAARRLKLADGGEIAYDYLVLATGSRTSYFGHEEWAAIAPGLKTVEDALEMRRRVLVAFEAAEREADPAIRRRLMTFVVIGGGPTGVELAGALAEIARYTMRRDFRAIDTAEARIILVEGGPRVLNTFPESLSASARRQLERLGVEVVTGKLAAQIDAEGVTFTDGGGIEAATVLWAAGVAAAPLTRTLGLPLDRAGRVTVAPDLRLPGHPEVYAIGDIALFTHQGGRPLPGVAPTAMQQGRAAAANIRRHLRGEPTHRFHYWDKGNVATIGRAAGVADFGWLRVSGLLAWLTWLVVHIYYLIGFGNRLIVLAQWAWSYFTHQRGARLITGDPTVPLGRRAQASAERTEPAPGAVAAEPPGDLARGTVDAAADRG
jgi:NADH dehydrogenase